MQVQLETKEQAWELIQKIEEQIQKVIVGQDDLIRRILIGLFGRIPYSFKRGQEEKAGSGHILLEGVPGLAKTLLVSAIASTIDAKFQRIQFTPDMLPADILGTRIFDNKTGQFRTEKGPIFANIVLADEINRAPQKTQSALLEAMQERQVTIGENTFGLDDPFWVLATQNPVEQEGVFSLPEAQLDRFCMMVRVHYPSAESEFQMLAAHLEQTKLTAVADPEAVLWMRQQAAGVYVDDKVRRYIVALGQATRNTRPDSLPIVKEMIQHGASPRSYQHLLAMSRTVAFFRGREYVLPADVKFIANDVLHHRLVRTIRAEVENVATDEVVAEVFETYSDPIRTDMLAPELAEELHYIEINASRRIRSLRFGQSRSPVRGSGYEFETHRKYAVGEDFRRIDWNVSARMQEIYLKRHFEEKEVTVFLLVDVSRSMRFSTAKFSKRMRVLQVASVLGFSAVSDSCNFGFLAFSDQVEAYEPPRKGRGHVWRTLERLFNLKPAHTGTNWEVGLRFLRSQLRTMSIVFLLSDFVLNPDATQLTDLPDLKVLAQKHDVVPIVFGDELESSLPFGRGLLRFRSAEGRREMLLSLSSSQRHAYDVLVEARKTDLRNLFYSLGMECLFLKVGEPFMDPLMMLFERRRKV